MLHHYGTIETIYFYEHTFADMVFLHRYGTIETRIAGHGPGSGNLLSTPLWYD